MEKPKKKTRAVKPKETEKKAPAAKKTTRKAATRKTSPKKESKEKLVSETPKAKKKAAPKKAAPKKASPKAKKTVAKTNSNPEQVVKDKKEAPPKRPVKAATTRKPKAEAVAKVEKNPNAKLKTQRVNRTAPKRNPKRVEPAPKLNAPVTEQTTPPSPQAIPPRQERQEPNRPERKPIEQNRPTNNPPERTENGNVNKRDDRRSDQGQHKRTNVKREDKRDVKRDDKRIVNKRDKRESPPRQTTHTKSSSRDDKRSHPKRDEKSNSSKSSTTDVVPTPKVRIHQSVAILVDGNNIEMSIHSMLQKKKAMINFDTLIPKLLKERGLNRLIYFREGKSISSKLAERLHNLYYGTVVPCHKSADIPLTIAATQISEKVDTIIILSGDADYVELVKHLTSRGVRVEIAAVEQTTASILRNAADFFFPITKDDCFVLG